MKGRFQSILEAKINEEISEKARSVASGTAKSYEEYKYWVGYLHGLAACLDICSGIERDESDERRSAA